MTYRCYHRAFYNALIRIALHRLYVSLTTAVIREEAMLKDRRSQAVPGSPDGLWEICYACSGAMKLRN